MRNVEIRRPVLVVPSANATYDVPLPTGHYYLSVFIKAAVTGATTKVAVAPFVDEARTQLNDQAFPFYQGDSATGEVEITVTAAAIGQSAVAASSVGALNSSPSTPVGIVGGVQVAITKGGATTAETLEVMLVATRIE